MHSARSVRQAGICRRFVRYFPRSVRADEVWRWHAVAVAKRGDASSQARFAGETAHYVCSRARKGADARRPALPHVINTRSAARTDTPSRGSRVPGGESADVFVACGSFCYRPETEVRRRVFCTGASYAAQPAMLLPDARCHARRCLTRAYYGEIGVGARGHRRRCASECMRA